MTTKVLLILIAATALWIYLRRKVSTVLERPDVRAARDFAQQMRRAAEARAPGGSGGGAAAVRLAACSRCATHVPESDLMSGTGGLQLCSSCRSTDASR